MRVYCPGYWIYNPLITHKSTEIHRWTFNAVISHVSLRYSHASDLHNWHKTLSLLGCLGRNDYRSSIAHCCFPFLLQIQIYINSGYPINDDLLEDNPSNLHSTFILFPSWKIRWSHADSSVFVYVHWSNWIATVDLRQQETRQSGILTREVLDVHGVK